MSIATEQLSRVSVQVGNQEITFETGKLAKQADGAVVVRSGETMVLATAVGRPDAREGADFFPLTIDVEERMYAAGKIPGGFFKREGRARGRGGGAGGRPRATAGMTRPPPRRLGRKGPGTGGRVPGALSPGDVAPPHDMRRIRGAPAALMTPPGGGGPA